MSEMTHATGGDGAWRQGTLSDDEFERAAMVFRPSWEIGLEAARTLDVTAIAPAPAEGSTAGGFAAASSGAREAASALVSLVPPIGLSMPSDKPAERTSSKPAEKPAERPADKAAAKPAAKPVDKAAAKPAERVSAKPAERVSAKPAVNAAPLDDEAPTTPQRKGGMLYGAIAGAVAVIALVGYFAFGSTPSSNSASTATNQTATTSAAPSTPEPAPTPSQPEVAPPQPAPAAAAPPAPEPAPAAAAPVAPEPAPAAAAPVAPEPAPAPPPAAEPEPPPAPAVAAPPVAAPAVAAPEVAPAPRVRAPRPPTRRSAPTRPRGPGGAGFVTDNPY